MADSGKMFFDDDKVDESLFSIERGISLLIDDRWDSIDINIAGLFVGYRNVKFGKSYGLPKQLFFY